MVREILAQTSPSELRRLLDGEADSLRVSETLDSPQSIPIAEVEVGETVTVVGTVTDVGEVNTFSRDDGSEGQVRNIQIQDRTAMISVALWGEDAVRSLEVGDVIQVLDAPAEDGFKDTPIQLKVGYDTRVRVFDQERDAQVVTLTLEDE